MELPVGGVYNMTSYNPKLKNKNSKLIISSSLKINGNLGGNVNLNSNTSNITNVTADVFQTSDIQINKPKTSLKNISSDAGLTSKEHMVFVDTTSGSVNVFLPSDPEIYQQYVIKKCDTSANYVTIYTPTKQEAILSGNLAINLNDYFGYSVALNSVGNIALVGAYQDEAAATLSTGLAYVFISGNSGWSNQATLSGSLATASSDNFGYSVALNSVGDVALINARTDEPPSFSSTGLVYVFRSASDGWLEESILSGSLATGSADYFGNSVALNSVGNIALVGADNDEAITSGNSSGLAYVFVSGNDGWFEQAILSGSLATVTNDYFGNYVSLNSAGDTALIGAKADEPSGTVNNGLAYVFKSGSNGWSQQTILSGTLAVATGDNFGYSVALNSTGDMALVGATGDEPTGTTGNGLAYLFKSGSNGWSQETIFSGSLATVAGDNFGYSLAINSVGDTVVIGARDDELSGTTGNGVVYVFKSASSGWQEITRVTGSLATSSADYFGASIAINSSGTKFIVGANGDEAPGRDLSSGVAYIFDNTVTPVVDSKYYYNLTGSYESVRITYDGNGNWHII